MYVCMYIYIYSRMRSRGVPVLRLGSRGPGGDARLLRLWTQAFAIVCNRSQASAVRRTCRKDKNRRETQNCRDFCTRLGSWRPKSVNSHRDRRGRGRETQNCRHFWTRLGSSRLKRKKTVTGIAGGRGRETQNCRHFWTRLASSRLKGVNSHRDRGGSWSRNPELSSLLDSSCVFASQKKENSHRDRGGSWSRNPELSSLLDSSCVFASEKCQQSQGSGGRGRETQNCRHF